MNFPRISRKTFLKGISAATGWTLMGGCSSLDPRRWLGFDGGTSWHNTLRPTGQAAEKVTVVRDRMPLGSICHPPQPTSEEDKAASDLQHWIEAMTGAIVPIHASNDGGGLIAIRTDPALGDEGYSIAVEKGRILLSGGSTRGVINAVYALLEEDVGCRFYTNDSIRVPKSRTLILAPVPRRVRPQLKIRDPFYACAFNPVWSLRNRTNAPNARVPRRYGGHMSYDGMFVHTAAKLVPPNKYFKEHPEYFAQQKNGKRTPAQLCATEPAVARIAAAYVRRVLRKHPDTTLVSVSKNDCQVVCHCPRCEALRKAEGSDMANQLVLVNYVAEAIEEDHPEVRVSTLAYLDTIRVPKTARPRKNVVIRLCNDAVGAWSHPFTPAEQCATAKRVRDWDAVGCPLYFWDYTINFSHYLAPMPNLDVIAANIRYFMRNHAHGIMLQGGYEGPAERDQMKCWVAAKLMWNPTLDERALARDFIRGHYGKAAPALEEYEALLEQMKTRHAAEMASPKNGIRYPMDAPFITKAFITRATRIFAQARTLAHGDATVTRRVDRATLPILYVQCVRGPEFTGKNYAAVVAEFARICQQVGVKCLREGAPDINSALASFRKRIPRTSTEPKPPGR